MASPESSSPYFSQKQSRWTHPNPQRKCHSSRGERPRHSPWEQQVSGHSGTVPSPPAPAAWHPGVLAEPPCPGPSPANGGFVHPPADSKAGPRATGPRGPTGPAMGQPGAEGESVFSKILPGGAAEQAGKLTEGECCSWGRGCSSAPRWDRAPRGLAGSSQRDVVLPQFGAKAAVWGPGQLHHSDTSPHFPTAVSAFGKKFTSFW